MRICLSLRDVCEFLDRFAAIGCGVGKKNRDNFVIQIVYKYQSDYI